MQGGSRGGRARRLTRGASNEAHEEGVQGGSRKGRAGRLMRRACRKAHKKGAQGGVQEGRAGGLTPIDDPMTCVVMASAGKGCCRDWFMASAVKG